MPQHQLTGTRIRERRLDKGVRQADLAKAAGISASYLNLIEHNRRRIGGRLLNDIARALGVEPTLLTEGAETAMLERLRLAATGDREVRAEVGRTEEFAGRFPGWAALVDAQSWRIAALEARIETLTDRMAHDPQLATSLHEVISAVTSIRSTSSILVSGDDLDRDWQQRFHRNIYDDSQRLAESSRALVGYLDRPEDSVAALLSPSEEAESWLAAQGWHIGALEGPAPQSVPEVVAGRAGLQNPAATEILTRHLRRYRHDAAAIPLDAFDNLPATADPAEIAAASGTDIATVLRRLATLPEGGARPRPGLAVCDGAGAITLLRALPGFSMQRGGAACPLWPLFRALGQPGQPIRAYVALPGDPALHFLCYAVAGPRGAPRFDMPMISEAVMLVYPVSPPANQSLVPLGTSCRICPREDCPARREPSVVSALQSGGQTL